MGVTIGIDINSLERKYNMSDIVYYFVPKEYQNKKEYSQNSDIASWTEIIVVDSEDIYRNRKWYENLSINFFVDKTKEVARLLWELREDDEKIIVKENTRKFRKKYVLEDIYDTEDLIVKLDELAIGNFRYVILYQKNGRVTKWVDITDGEALDLFVKNENVDKVDAIISKWADNADYFKYELGQEE